MEITQEMNKTLGGMSWSLLQFAHKTQAKDLPQGAIPTNSLLPSVLDALWEKTPQMPLKGFAMDHWFP